MASRSMARVKLSAFRYERGVTKDHVWNNREDWGFLKNMLTIGKIGEHGENQNVFKTFIYIIYVRLFTMKKWDNWDTFLGGWWVNLNDPKCTYKQISGQVIIFHQPGFAWNKKNSRPKSYLLGVRSCEVAIIWPDPNPPNLPTNW